MADELSVSQSRYQRMESGEVYITGNMVDKIAEVLEVNRELLYSFDEKFIFQGNAIQQGGSHIVNHYSSGAINLYPIDHKLEKLYEDKIVLLEAEIRRLREELKRR